MASPTSISPIPVSGQNEPLVTWPFNLKTYTSAETYGIDAATKLSDFERKHLSKETEIRWLSYSHERSVKEAVLKDDSIYQISGKPSANPIELLFVYSFINRFILRPDCSDYPKDIKRLRISGLAFRYLLSRYEMASSLIPAISGSLAGSPIQHRLLNLRNRFVLDVWYILPIRAEVKCTEQAQSHVLSTAGSNQMDPSQYLHLNDVGRDIRPSKIVVSVQHDMKSHETRAICIDFQDGRWWKLADEPFSRSKEALKQYEQNESRVEPFFIHVLLLTSVSQWWRSTLLCFDSQLIAYEKKLQQQMYAPANESAEPTNEINRALHTMASHLHRYETEIGLLEEIISCLSRICDCDCVSIPSHDTGTGFRSQNLASSLNIVAADFKSLRILVEELGKKTQTILGLLFNNIQMMNDSLILANANSMRNIMKATRAETKLSRKMAKQSQAMAVEMRKDSLSMKTIAILTMFFLPGTSFAVVLSMPFFSQMKWMSDAGRIWIWVVLTIPTTMIAFMIYLHFSRNGAHNIPGTLGNNGGRQDIEMNDTESDIEG